MTDDPFDAVSNLRDDFLLAAAQRLMTVQPLAVKDLTPSMIPDAAGVYIFYQAGSPDPFHIGESMNLRSRIYRSQVRGNLRVSPVKRKIKKQYPEAHNDALTDFIREHFTVRFMEVPLGRIELEGHLHDHYGIVESSPNA